MSVGERRHAESTIDDDDDSDDDTSPLDRPTARIEKSSRLALHCPSQGLAGPRSAGQASFGPTPTSAGEPRKMNGLAGSVSTAGQLYVRALYDYDADDRTSLSFRQGDIIQVITQLESGWWDGVIHGVRGWFPSNYCAVVASPYEDGMGNRIPGDSEAEESEEDYTEHAHDHGANGVSNQHDSASANQQEEAAFWIPQATPDGRLFYFNTLTGESTMELPLEAPTSVNETGPRDRTNIFIPDQTRPPAEFLAAGGYERDDETDYASASEAEDASVTQGSKASSVSNTFARAVHCAIYVTLANTANLSASTQTVVSVRRCVTSNVHGFFERSVPDEPLSHKSYRSKQHVAFGDAAGDTTSWYNHEFLR